MKKDRVEKGRSRGGLWVMLRDETPRGFIEERRREKEKGKKRRKRRERKRNAEAGSALILKSTLGGLSPAFSRSLSPSFCLSLFFNPAKRALQRDENPAGHHR